MQTQIIAQNGCKKTIRAERIQEIQSQPSPSIRQQTSRSVSPTPYIKQFEKYDQGYTYFDVGRPAPRFDSNAEKYRSSVDFTTYKRLISQAPALPRTLYKHNADDKFLEPQAQTRRSYHDQINFFDSPTIAPRPLYRGKSNASDQICFTQQIDRREEQKNMRFSKRPFEKKTTIGQSFRW